MIKSKAAPLCLILISSITLVGCGGVSHVPLNPQETKSIKTVQVDPKIKKPDALYEMGSGPQYGMLLGPIGGAISGAADAKDAVKTKEFAEKNNINIQDIVYQQWNKQLADKSKFKLSKQPSDAVLVTEIKLYGISIPHGFSSVFTAVLNVNARLVRNNKVVWQDYSQVLPLTSGMPKFKMDDIKKDPHKLYVMWDKAAEKVVGKLIKDMNG